MSFFAELQRRNVIRVGIAYVILSWLVLQIGDLLFDLMGLPDWALRIVLGILALGLLPVLVFAWAFEMTPEGIKRESEVVRAASVTGQTAHKLNVVVILLLVSAMGLFVFDRIHGLGGDREPFDPRQESADAGGASIAVLPFTNLSGSADNEYFSDGLTETLLHMLAQVENLRVAARTSAFAFKGRNIDIREIARQLNVTTVLEGSVQRAGDRVRITAQLVDAITGSQLWSESFDRDLDDIFAIQDEIANAVAGQLAASLLGQETAPARAREQPTVEAIGTTSMEAYDAYLRGLAYAGEDNFSSLRLAEAAYKEALVIDPAFREARLAMTFNYLSMGETALIQRDEANRVAREALAPLVASDPDDPVVVAYDIYIEFREQREQRLLSEEDRVAYFQRLAPSIARAPNEPELYLLAADLLEDVSGRGEERLAYIERGLAIDPLNTELLSWEGRILAFDLDRDADALATFARITELEPGNANGLGLAGLVHGRSGNFLAAFRAFAQGAQIDRQDHELPALAARSLVNLGLVDEAKPWVERARLLQPDGGATLAAQLAQLHAAGQREDALALAEDVLRARIPNRRFVYTTAAFVYGSIMADRERADAALAVFDEIAPGSGSDPSFMIEDPVGFTLATTGWALVPIDGNGVSERERGLRVAMLDRTFPGWRDDDYTAPGRFMLGIDDRDTAARTLADAIDRGYGHVRRVYLDLPALAPLRDHPAVQEALARNDERIAAQREEYRRLVASGELSGA